jgi:hypothetical protein
MLQHRPEQAAVVEPVHPPEPGELDCLDAAPRSTPTDHLGLEQAVDGLGESVVVAVADTADRGFDTSLDEPVSYARPRRHVRPRQPRIQAFTSPPWKPIRGSRVSKPGADWVQPGRHSRRGMPATPL